MQTAASSIKLMLSSKISSARLLPGWVSPNRLNTIWPAVGRDASPAYIVWSTSLRDWNCGSSSAVSTIDSSVRKPAPLRALPSRTNTTVSFGAATLCVIVVKTFFFLPTPSHVNHTAPPLAGCVRPRLAGRMRRLRQARLRAARRRLVPMAVQTGALAAKLLIAANGL